MHEKDQRLKFQELKTPVQNAAKNISKNKILIDYPKIGSLSPSTNVSSVGSPLDSTESETDSEGKFLSILRGYICLIK